MKRKNHLDTGIITLAESVCRWSLALLDKAPLTDDQREDIVAIHTASQEFVDYASSQLSSLTVDSDIDTRKRIRHQLRNYINIIIGFSSLIVKDLPDNLLMDMVTVRKIHDTGEMLRIQVDAIQ